MAAVMVVGVVVVSTAAGEAVSTEEAAMVEAVSMAVGMGEEAFMAGPPMADITAVAIAVECMAEAALGILAPEGPGDPKAMG
jgi:hypothetical protein